MEFDNDMLKDAFSYSGQEQLEAWDDYRNRFALAPKDVRVHELRLIDTWLQEPKPRKDFASIWGKHRELFALHNQLMKIGR